MTHSLPLSASICFYLHHHTPYQMADRAPLVRDRAEYERLYKWSIDDPQDFWASMAQDYFWAKKVRGFEGPWFTSGW